MNIPLWVCSIVVGSIASMVDDATGFGVGVIVVVVDFVVVVSEKITDWENLIRNDEE